MRAVYDGIFSLPMIDIMVIFSLMMIGILSLILVRRHYGMLCRLERDYRERQIALEGALSETFQFLAAEPGRLLIWLQDRVEEAPLLFGRDNGLISVAAGSADGKDERGMRADYVGFLAMLDAEQCGIIEKMRTDLMAHGRNFCVVVMRCDGHWIEAVGTVIGVGFCVRLRDVTAVHQLHKHLESQVAALEHDHHRLRDGLAALPLPIWLRDHDGGLIWTNRAYVTAVGGVSMRHVVDEGTYLIEPPPRRVVGDDDVGVLHEDQVYAVSLGKRRAYQLYEARLEDAVLGLVLDETERLDTEQRFHNDLDAQHSILNLLNTAVAIFGTEQKLTYYNDAYVELWGLDRSWLDQAPTDSEIFSRLLQEQRLPEEAGQRAWRNQFTALYKALDPYEDWWYRPDGKVLRVYARPRLVGGVVYLYEDVSGEVELKSKYETINWVQRETLDNLRDAVALFGSNGRLTLSNKAFSRLWSLTPDQVENNPHIDDISEICRHNRAGLNAVWDALKPHITSLGARLSLDRQFTEDAESAMIESRRIIVTVTTLSLSAGDTLVTFADATSAVRYKELAEERNKLLETRDREKNDFIADTVYQLGAPLTSLMGFCELLRQAFAGPITPRQQDYLDNVTQAASQLHQLVTAFYDLTEIEQGSFKIDLQNIDIADVLRKLEAIRGDMAGHKQVNLQIRIPDQPLYVMADASKLFQIIFNIVSNAIEFSTAGQTIWIEAELRGSRVYCRVDDDGPRLSEEDYVDAFKREPSPTKSRFHGAGPGLSLVWHVLELQNGAIRISVRAGGGMRIEFDLPAPRQQTLPLTETGLAP